MPKFLNAIINLGIRPGLSPAEIKSIRLLNILVSLAALFIGLYSLLFAFFSPGSKLLLVVCLLTLPLCLVSLFSNGQGRYGFARDFSHVVSTLFLLAVSVITGRDAQLYFFMLTVMISIIFTFSPAERPAMVRAAGLVFASFLGLQIWFLFIPPIEPFAPGTLGLLQTFAGTGIFLFVSGFAIYIFFEYSAAEARLAEEKARSDRLLLNVLPREIAERLKQGEGRIADRHEEVSILFSDIVNFSGLAGTMHPVRLVELLDEIFSTFDALAQRHGLEKIKTIGDAYMVVAGLPTPRPDHCAAMADMALEMIAATISFASRGCSLRIGMHSGPVIAGVIGTKKFNYDLWGDTVNTASRMESHGKPGSIHVSESVYLCLKNDYQFEDRGEIQVKGKGAMNTYFLVAKK